MLLAEASNSAAKDIVSPEMEFGLPEKAFEELGKGILSPEPQYQNKRIQIKYAQYKQKHKKVSYIW